MMILFSLPTEVVRRVNALRNLQVEHHKIEASFFEEVHALECRYLSKYQPLYEKVSTISNSIKIKLEIFFLLI
jgi:nucleosome assembly protein 1-like 1